MDNLPFLTELSLWVFVVTGGATAITIWLRHSSKYRFAAITVVFLLVYAALMVTGGWYDYHEFKLIQSELKSHADSQLKSRIPVNISAVRLSSAYLQNKTAADRDYKFRKLVVTGQVIEVSLNRYDEYLFVRLAGEEDGKDIACYFAMNEVAGKAFKPNEQVTFSGTCVGLIRKGISLRDCRIEYKPLRPSVITFAAPIISNA